MNMKTKLLTALAFAAVAANGQITLNNVNDTFTGATIVSNDAVSQLTWVRYSTTNAELTIPENPVGNNVLQVGGNGSFKGVYAITPGAAITLAQGESLSLNYDFEFIQNPSNTANAIRFGFYNSNGTAGAADAFGYHGNFGSGTNTTVSVGIETGTNGTVLGGTDITFPAGSGVGQSAIGQNTAVNLGMTLTRTGDSAITIGLFQNDTLVWTATDSSASNFTFDMIALGVGNTSADYQIDNVIAIPEPGTLVLVGIALGSLLFFRRRR